MRKWITVSLEDITDFDWRLTYLADEFKHALVLTDRYVEPSGVYGEMASFKILAGFGALDSVTCTVNELELKINQDDWYLGFFSYELKRELFNHQGSCQKATVNFPVLFFFRPRYLIKNDGDKILIGYDDAHDDEASASNIIEKIKAFQKDDAQKSNQNIHVIQNVSQLEYFKAVDHMKKHIIRGDIYEINYCMEFTANCVTQDPQSLFSKMMDLSPMPFSAFLKNDEDYVLCASPERYLKKSGRKVISMPMKGTALRRNQDVTLDSDKALLKNSEKEQAENIMIADLVRNDLSRVAKAGTVKVEELCGIYSFPRVLQMVSTVSCEMKIGVKWAEPIRCSFPMGSMTGAPKQRALELIDAYEKGSRGIYSGAIGYITPQRDFDFNVVIRSLFLNRKLGKASFWVGSAITAQANANDEYNECLLKAGVLMNLLNQ